MVKIYSSLLVLLGLLCLTWGWEPGTQYVYKYVGRSATGINKLKQQNAVVELESIVTVQSVDDYTLAVQLTYSTVKRNGYFLGNALDRTQDIEGEADEIPDLDVLYAPFTIYHKQGSISGIKTGAGEPLWIVNIKKAIASQLQLDVTGVRNDGAAFNYKAATKDGEKATLTVLEDSVTGDCSTSIEISRLPYAQVFASAGFKLESFDDVCGSKPVYQILKTKDFNNCKTNPAWHTTTSNSYECDLDKANCGHFLKRTAVTKYVACGESLSKLTIVYAGGYSDLMAQPFATKTDELVNAVITKLTLEKKESIGSHLAAPAYPKEHKSLNYVFGDFNQLSQDGVAVQPNLHSAYAKSPAPIEALHGSVLDSLQVVASDLKENSDSDQDNLDRLAVIGRVLPMFSLDELRYLWEDVKNQDAVVVTLFIDCVVQAGSNPTVMLIKELIETEQITGQKASWAMAALGYHVKTPTQELLKELVNLLKSDPVQSSKQLLQTSLMTVADLLNSACSSRHSAAKKYPVSVMGDFCDSKSKIISYEFLPLLAKELESSTEVFDRMVVLAAIGNLGVEEVVPVLLPVIRGNDKFDDTAERLRAILSLQRVVLTVPEKIHPMLASLAGNAGERAEIRMASLGLLLMSNAPHHYFQKFAASTWFEPSRQMASFTHTLINSLSKVPASTPMLSEIASKATIAICLAKPGSTQPTMPFSFGDIQSSHMTEGIAVMMRTITHRDPDQPFAAYLSNSYYYQLGPLAKEVLTINLWNFNMFDTWSSIMGRIYGSVNPKYGALWAAGEKLGDKKEDALKGIWDALYAIARPADKTAGLMHIDMLGGSVNRFANFADLTESIPKFMAANMNRTKETKISTTKYRMLGDYNARFATELGLPMRYLFNLATVFSIQGEIKSDGKGGIDTDLNVLSTWKLVGEIRVDVPFSGSYIATGVDVLIDSHAPRNMNFAYPKQKWIINMIPSDQIIDLLYYHVKPYTVSRSFIKPTLEGQELYVISVTDKPLKRDFNLGGQLMGVNVKMFEETESLSNNFSWRDWLSKWDMNSFSNLGMLPLELNNRKYKIRYDPYGTTGKNVAISMFFQYAAKSSTNNLVYESGSSQARYPTEPEVISYSPIRDHFRPLVVNLFSDIENGNARLMETTVTAEGKNGTIDHFSSTVGMAMNTRYTKDCLDWQAEHSTTGPNGYKKVNSKICYKAVRKWNNPPIYGFSKDVLEMTEEDDIGFGPECERKVHFTAKLSRDESAAQAAINSASGKQCLKDMASGLEGSPACTEARILDHTYNNYEMKSVTDNMVDWWLQWARGFSFDMNRLIEPFIVEHKHAQTNTPGQASWSIKRDPLTGESDMTFVRPHEVVVAKNVREDVMASWKRFSPMTFLALKSYYPLSAGTNFIAQSLNWFSGGVSEAKCYVGSSSVDTFDGASYKYAVDGNYHVLLTDCSRRSQIAILARKGNYGQKIITVHLGKDTIEMDPTAYVSVNGAKTDFTKMEKGSFIEIRTPGSKSIKMVVFPMPEGGLIFDIRSIQFWMKIKGDYVELSAPIHMRGRACGLCGDFNQELTGEFKTADRCVLTSGELMAASFKLTGDNYSNTYAAKSCLSADQQFNTYLPDYDLKATGYSAKGKCQDYDRPESGRKNYYHL
ncbi:vitellogenin-like [Daphnia pulicaria]|uniref:vitellogenin-like n=1 Tax=Daphnia pulicaria TaxID=35523 RepID=UPI001EEAFAB8|nr:vitellogenin-like [Daphnia pulicaria]